MRYGLPVQSLYTHLVDDAALFPPGNAPMPEAVAGHRAAAAGQDAWLTGPFLCPTSRLEELGGQLETGDRFELGLIVDGGPGVLPAALGAVREDPRLMLSMVEIPLPKGTDPVPGAHQVLAALPDGVPAYVELPRQPGWEDALDAVAAAGKGAKLRAGGVRSDLFPSVAEVAAFVQACVQRNVPFKCTAGLHHAVRYVDESTGFTHHGFLNILVATCRAVMGKDDLVTVLTTTDESYLANAARAVDEATARSARSSFVSYGSCSLAEPIADLTRLKLLGGRE